MKTLIIETTNIQKTITKIKEVATKQPPLKSKKPYRTSKHIV